MEFQLTSTSDLNITKSNIGLIYQENTIDPRFGYNSDIDEIRNRINKISHFRWKQVRWFINNYDFLVTGKIINRAFFKLWEIINKYDLIDEEHINSSAFIAEAPGGFLQAFQIYMESFNIHKLQSIQMELPDDGFKLVTSKRKPKIIDPNFPKMHTITLKSNTESSTTFNSSINHPALTINYGIDGSGNICNKENVLDFKKYFDDKKAQFITADGGLDEGTDYNHKEQLHQILFFYEILIILMNGSVGSNCVLKVFDTYTETSFHLLYLLSHFYTNVLFYKPLTSRPTNSEKYVVCRNRKDIQDSESFLTFLLDWISNQTVNYKTNCSIRIFKEIDPEFRARMLVINTKMRECQYSFIKKALDLCESKVDLLSIHGKENVNNQRTRIFNEWKQKYKLKI